jgi:hypothetical protein
MGSIAQGDFTSEVLDRDYSVTTPDDGLGGIAVVRAGSGLGGGVADTLPILLTTSYAYRKNCELDIETSAPAGATLPFEVVIKDRSGNPLGGHELTITSSRGSVVPATALTDSYGSATASFLPALTDSGTVVITAIDNDPNYGGVTLSKSVTVTTD